MSNTILRPADIDPPDRSGSDDLHASGVDLPASRHAKVGRLDHRQIHKTVPRSGTDGEGTPTVDLDVWALHLRYYRTRSRADLPALVEEYRGFALSIARRMHRSGEPREDLEQVALEALVESLQRFDPFRRRRFVSFAGPTIAGAVKRHFRDRGWLVRAPRQVHELAGPIRTSRDHLTSRLGRPPSDSEVGAAVGVGEPVVRSVDQAVRARSVAALDRPMTPDGDPIGEMVGGTDHNLDTADDRVSLASALKTLSGRDRRLLELYFFHDMPQREIAERFGVSQMQVSRWLKRICGSLRACMEAS